MESEILAVRLEELEKRITARMDAMEAMREVYLQTLATAREKAEQAVNERLEKMNEFRTQLDRQAATFVTKSELDSRFDRAVEAVRLAEVSVGLRSSRQDERIDNLERYKDKTDGSLRTVWIGVTLLIAAVQLLVHFLKF